jgi:hypothetical protein
MSKFQNAPNTPVVVETSDFNSFSESSEFSSSSESSEHNTTSKIYDTVVDIFKPINNLVVVNVKVAKCFKHSNVSTIYDEQKRQIIINCPINVGTDGPDHFESLFEYPIDRTINEKILFHGVRDYDNVKKISENGFDVAKSTYGKQGKGTYFTDDLYTAHRYANKATRHCIIISRVILGDPVICPMINRTRTEPPKGYDSVINKKRTEFTVYEPLTSVRCIPAYIVEFMYNSPKPTKKYSHIVNLVRSILSHKNKKRIQKDLDLCTDINILIDRWEIPRMTETISPLMVAIRVKRDDIVAMMLIKKGVMINMQDGLGKTALHHAVEIKWMPGILGLLSGGASQFITDRRGNNAIHTVHPIRDKCIMTILVDNAFSTGIPGSIFSDTMSIMDLKILSWIAKNSYDDHIICFINDARNKITTNTKKYRSIKCTIIALKYDQCNVANFFI